jgi:hypothetical protein
VASVADAIAAVAPQTTPAARPQRTAAPSLPEAGTHLGTELDAEEPMHATPDEPTNHATGPDDGAADAPRPVESHGFRVISASGPDGHYGAHRGAHHTSPASIPPPSQAFDPDPEGPASGVMDLGALHREAVAALSEEGSEVRVRVDDDVSVDVRVEGDAVHVVLETTEAAARDFDGLQHELADQLAQSGADLGSYAQRSRDDGSDPERPAGRGTVGEGASADVDAPSAAPVARGRLVNRIA